MNALLQTLIEEFREKMTTFTGGVDREIHFPTIANKIMVAIGMRRTGKTYSLLQVIQKLLKDVPITRILYISFEDDRLLPMTQKEFGRLVDAFYTLYPENHDHLCYLFFDEIQNVDQWHTVIRRCFDTKKVKIYLTGSSAKLLSKEINTSLQGRSYAVEIWPFSFSEYLMTKQIDKPDKVLKKNTLDKLKGHLSLYMEQGGFPKNIFLNPQLDQQAWRQTLQDYVSIVILRNIVERYHITNIALIRYMIKTLLGNTGCSFAVHKFYSDLKSQGFSVGKDTIHDYLGYISDAYLAFPVSLYDDSLRKVQTNPKKIYAVDTGLAKAYTMRRTQDTGHYFENLVYLDLRRSRHEEICYYLTKTRKEVDFMARNGLGEWRLYQVCWDISDPNILERETVALEEAKKESGIEGEIITPDSYFTSFLPRMNLY